MNKWNKVDIEIIATAHCTCIYWLFTVVCPKEELYDRRLRIWPSFPDRSSEIAMSTDFSVQIGEIGLFTFIRHLGIPKQSGISQFRF